MFDTGLTVYLIIEIVCLRYFWSMVPVKYRYLHYEKSGYWYFGRAITGVLLISTEFGVSPSYFDTKVRYYNTEN